MKAIEKFKKRKLVEKQEVAKNSLNSKNLYLPMVEKSQI